MRSKLSTAFFVYLLLLPSAFAAQDNNKVQIPPPYSYADDYFDQVYLPEASVKDEAVKSKKVVVTKLTAMSMVADQLIVDITFNDANLEACVLTTANDNSWTLASQVTRIKCDGQNIADTNGLQHFTSLDYLSLKSNQISDISPLSELTMLSRVYLSDNQISQIDGLSNLLSLQYLLLDRNQISDLTVLMVLTQLRTLFLYDNQISELSPLAGLTQLQRLQLAGNQISDLTALSGLAALEWLLLGGNQITDIGLLGSLNSLQILDLNINNISDVSALAGLTTLHTVYLGYNQISDISPLNNLINVETLLLQNNQISELSALANLTKLQTLYLQYNQIANITVLNNLTDATTINLFSNNEVNCNDLDTLEATLGAGIVTRPATCVVSSAEDELKAHWSGKSSGKSSGQSDAPQALDVSTNNHHGLFQNGVTTTAGMVGDALNFDGVDDHLRVADSEAWAFGSKDFTISFWINPTAYTAAYTRVISHWQWNGGSNRAWEFYINGGQLTFASRSAFSLRTTTTLTTGNWYHIALTRSQGVARIYVNGELEKTNNSAGHTLNNSSVALLIGATIDRNGIDAHPGDMFGGKLDEIKVYHSALSASEIAIQANPQ